MALIQLEHTRAIPTCNWRESMFITTRLPVANMFPGLFWLIWSQVLWILFVPDLLDRFSALITLCLVSVEKCHALSRLAPFLLF